MKTPLTRREAISLIVFFGALFGLGVHEFDRWAEYQRALSEHEYVDQLRDGHEKMLKQIEKLRRVTGCA